MLSNKLIIQFTRPHVVRIILTILLGFSGGLFNGVSTTLIVPIVLKIIGQKVDLNNAPPILKMIMAPFDSVPENYRLIVMSLSVVLIIFLKNIANYSSTLSSSSLKRMLVSDIREVAIKQLLYIDISYYTKMKLGDLMNRFNTEISRAANSISNLITLTIIAITILVFLVVLMSISWQLTICSTLLLSLVALVNQYTIYRSKHFGKVLSDTARNLTNTLLETLSGIRLVKATANEERTYQKIQTLIRAREKAEFQSQLLNEVITPVSEVTGIASIILIVFLGKILFADKIASLSAILLTYLLVLLRVLPLISQLNTLRSSFANNSASMDVVTDFLQRDNKPFMVNGKVTYTKLQEGVHFNHISFGYPGNDKVVLKDVDLYLPRGTILALVGSSGAGKSTLADLLPRFYDPNSGCITIDGVDLREFNLQSLRKAMGIVSQDTFLFNDSVRNNIAYGRPEATSEEIITAAKQANAYEFIIKLPQGFDTLIGDRGVMLSGGQRQRLAIARALLQDPEILILDEATSALDTVSERLVQGAIDALSRDRTTLVIAHRLSTVQKAHQIAVMDQGHVVEMGTHEELLQQGGYYSRLYSMQFAEQNEVQISRDERLKHIADEVQSKLNPMIDHLRLLLDETVEKSQNRQELIDQSFNLAVEILNTIESFEDSLKLQISLKETSLTEPQKFTNTQNTTLMHISHQIRIRLNSMLGFLRLLADGFVDSSKEENELIQGSYYSAIDLLNSMNYLKMLT
ncbi:ABC transporter ATP-binding protein [Scytonema hofmannii PCC 7110]|uniref:ABC transporter ATP-binding protein n=1 Tax=Scytonema hofmannii PCC 7110 TaxID=128403 RepID=A0A139XBB0_9CYAN|nr:ABC transporter ATP-binding protein [Scytonema hofmannii]KYC41987.1 ABC transporter ATP-binding protein [Scytonema hofmannii PCC 7110]